MHHKNSLRENSMDFETLLKESAKIHGHLCPGQVLGVRMAMYGLRLIGIQDPKGADRKKLIVFVEIDRCAVDAIQSVTGCSLGHRTLKYVDYGKMAATFVNLHTNKAVRIIAKETAKDTAKLYCPEIDNKYEAQKEAYKLMSDEELFDVCEVQVEISEFDMPGRPLKRAFCNKCAESIQDGRDITLDGKTLCKACAYGGYYSYVKKA